jgi:hypothetical protein
VIGWKEGRSARMLSETPFGGAEWMGICCGERWGGEGLGIYCGNRVVENSEERLVV